MLNSEERESVERYKNAMEGTPNDATPIVKAMDCPGLNIDVVGMVLNANAHAPATASAPTAEMVTRCPSCAKGDPLGSRLPIRPCGDPWHLTVAENRIADLTRQLQEAQKKQENWHAVVKDICEEWSEANGATCSSSCDSYGHAEDCKATLIVEYLKSLRRQLQEAQAQIETYTALANNLARPLEASKELSTFRALATRAKAHEDTEYGSNAKFNLAAQNLVGELAAHAPAASAPATPAEGTSDA